MTKATTNTPNLEPLMTYREVGKLLGVTQRTVWSLVDSGELPAVRFGGSVRIAPSDLHDFILRGKTRAPSTNKTRQNRGAA